MSSDYVELGARSAFSFLDGASLPEDLAARASELDLPALCLTDFGGFYGSPRFHQAAVNRGVRALVGARIDITSTGWVRLLCENQKGYRNLSRLLTLGHRDRPKGECEVSLERLREHAGGLTCLYGPGRIHLAESPARALHAIFGPRFAIEVGRHLNRREEAQTRTTLDLASAIGASAVATNDVRFATPRQKALCDVLTCIREHTTVDAAGRKLLPNSEWRLKSPKEMAALFKDHPKLIRQSRAIAERCAFTLENLGYRFPDYPVPRGETQLSFLHKLTFEGARKRYRPLRQKEVSQLTRELNLIGKLQLEGYFLIVWDLVRFAQQNDILAQGRGSAANSAVCYALGITSVDPIGMELLFERFLSEERGEWPDIDLDLPSGDKREAVIQYVYDKYGPHGAAMTANVITYRDKSALREVGKALGFSPEQIDKISKIGARWSSVEDSDQLTERMRTIGLDPDERRTKLWMHLSGQILHMPRHLGQHSGGMVIAKGRLDEVTPIEPATMENRKVIQWDKDDCNNLGIIKVDLLGLGMLAALEEAVPLIKGAHGVDIDYAHIPKSDPQVFDLLCNADTVGLFQVESRAQMATLPRLRPRCFYDLVIEIALIRPGPISGQMVHPYLRRRAGREPVVYAHPDLEPILERTLGVPIFQEQVMRVAMTVAGFTGGEAEELRRAMGFKRSTERMQDIENRLLQGMKRRGISAEVQEEIIRNVTSFASYGFPESHSASFALIAYASAYLKVHYPAAFLAAMLNAYPLGFYHPSTLVKDIQRRGVRVLPIDVTQSSYRCGLHDENTVRLGLKYVSGIKEHSVQRIMAERSRRPFRDLADFQRRCQLSEPERLALAELGAFASLGHTRRQALWQLSRLSEYSEGLLARVELTPENSPLHEMSLPERIFADYKNSEMSVGRHPMSFWRTDLASRGSVTAQELKRIRHGRRAKTAGFVITRQRPMTAKGFFFITLEDETGFTNLIVTPDQFEKNRRLVVATGALWVEGVVQNQEGVVHLKCDRFRSMFDELPADERAPASVPKPRHGGGYARR